MYRCYHSTALQDYIWLKSHYRGSELYISLYAYKGIIFLCVGCDHRREKTRLEQLQQEQKVIEERNKRKKALLAKTIAEKYVCEEGFVPCWAMWWNNTEDCCDFALTVCYSSLCRRSKQTQAEAVKLKRIQKELQALDDMVSNDIGILRGKIEQASWDYTAARYKDHTWRNKGAFFYGEDACDFCPIAFIISEKLLLWVKHRSFHSTKPPNVCLHWL